MPPKQSGSMLIDCIHSLVNFFFNRTAVRFVSGFRRTLAQQRELLSRDGRQTHTQAVGLYAFMRPELRQRPAAHALLPLLQ
jgi:hypothetical protein